MPTTPNIILIKRRLADSILGTSTIPLSVGEYAYNEVNHTLYLGTSSRGTLDIAGPGSYARLSVTNALTGLLQSQINNLSVGSSTQLQSVSSTLNTKIDATSSSLTSNINDLRSYTNSSFLPLSGGIITGNTRINSNLTVLGSFSATGTSYFANTIYSTTSALSVVHVGNDGPALYVSNNGTGDIASFYDSDQNVEVLHVGGNNGSFPNVGVKTSSPNKDLTINGELSTSNIIYDRNGNSNQWNSAYTIVNSNSADWGVDIDTGVRGLTGNYSSTYTTVQTNSADWGIDIDTGVRSLTANYSSTYTTVRSNSADWGNSTQKLYRNSNFYAENGRSYIVDTSSQRLSALLPDFPNIGDNISFQDSQLTWKKNNFTINSSMDKIQFVNEPLNCDLNGLYFSLTYFGNSNGWRID